MARYIARWRGTLHGGARYMKCTLHGGQATTAIAVLLVLLRQMVCVSRSLVSGEKSFRQMRCWVQDGVRCTMFGFGRKSFREISCGGTLRQTFPEPS